MQVIPTAATRKELYIEYRVFTDVSLVIIANGTEDVFAANRGLTVLCRLNGSYAPATCRCGNLSWGGGSGSTSAFQFVVPRPKSAVRIRRC
jgi:hypothetical protein